MERELRLVIIDSDYGYIKQMEEALIRRFRSRAQIQIITDPAYLDVYFRTPRTIDILVADQSFYAEHLEEHTIHHILLLVPEVDIEKTFPDKVKERKEKQKRKKTIRLRLRSKSPVMPTTRVRTTSKDFWTAWHNME